jgi:hypothetical protein
MLSYKVTLYTDEPGPSAVIMGSGDETEIAAAELRLLAFLAARFNNRRHAFGPEITAACNVLVARGTKGTP